jgi:hypothetical protein
VRGENVGRKAMVRLDPGRTRPSRNERRHWDPGPSTVRNVRRNIVIHTVSLALSRQIAAMLRIFVGFQVPLRVPLRPG